MTDIGQSGRRRFIWWLALTAVFWSLGSMVANALSMSFSWVFGLDPFPIGLAFGFSRPEPWPYIAGHLIQGLLVGIFTGLFVGLGQWLVIRKWLPHRTGWWMPITAAGKGLGVAVGSALGAVLAILLTRLAPADPLSRLAYSSWRWFGLASNLISSCGAALGYCLGGIGQWFIVRESGRIKASRWLIAVGIGGICVISVAFIASMVTPLIWQLLFSYSERNGVVIYKGLLAGRDPNHQLIMLLGLAESLLANGIAGGLAACFTGWELFRDRGEEVRKQDSKGMIDDGNKLQL